MAEFDLKVGSFKGHADLDADPENMFTSLAEKLDSQRLHKALDFLKQYENQIGVGAGILSLLGGKDIDPPFIESGKHSYGVKNLNLGFLKGDPNLELQYNYGQEEDPFNFQANLGADEENQYMKIGGTYKFAGGGLATLSAY